MLRRSPAPSREVGRSGGWPSGWTVLLKDHTESTVTRAHLATKAAGGAIRVFGGIVLNHAVGGVNPEAADFALAIGGRKGEAATELKLGHCAGLDDPYHVGAVKFAELAKSHSRDAVRVLVFPSCQLGNGEREMIEGVKLGTLEMVLTASAPIAGFEPKFMLFDLPFLFRDNGHAHRVLDGPVGQKVAASLEPHGDQAARVDGVGLPEHDHDPEADRGAGRHERHEVPGATHEPRGDGPRRQVHDRSWKR